MYQYTYIYISASLSITAFVGIVCARLPVCPSHVQQCCVKRLSASSTNKRYQHVSPTHNNKHCLPFLFFFCLFADRLVGATQKVGVVEWINEIGYSMGMNPLYVCTYVICICIDVQKGNWSPQWNADTGNYYSLGLPEIETRAVCEQEVQYQKLGTNWFTWHRIQ